MLANKLAGSGSVPQVYVDDVFAADTYVGTNGSMARVLGINLQTYGGLVWDKQRGVQTNYLIDTLRGATNYLQSDSISSGAVNANYLTSFTTTGFNTGTGLSVSGVAHSTWVFRKAPKFFDMITWTGDGTSSKILSHNLGAKVAFAIVKSVSSTVEGSLSASWWVAINTAGDTWVRLKLESNAANFYQTTTSFDAPATGSSSIDVYKVGYSAGGGGFSGNTSGQNYIAYLFPDDTSPTGIIRCSAFTTDASGNATVNTGWEPQACMFKASSGAGDWYRVDNVRGWDASGTAATLLANSTAAESETAITALNSSGFTITGASASTTYIFMAIRRSNKPASSASALLTVSTAATAWGISNANPSFKTDLVIAVPDRTTPQANARFFVDRVRGFPRSGNAPMLDPTTTAIETTTANTASLFMQYVKTELAKGGTWGANFLLILLGRAVGFFDIARYSGNGTRLETTHNLGVAPEMIIVKGMDDYGAAKVYHKTAGASSVASLTSTGIFSSDIYAFNTEAPNASTFVLGTGLSAITKKYVAYLFASKLGISKVGTYVGNGGTQNINCDFTTGARLVLVKSMDVAAGDWVLFDTVRGITAGTDPYLLLNSASSESSDYDYIAPYSAGFQIWANPTRNVNVSGTNYIFLAIA
jgi:hypothetical protein